MLSLYNMLECSFAACANFVGSRFVTDLPIRSKVTVISTAVNEVLKTDMLPYERKTLSVFFATFAFFARLNLFMTLVAAYDCAVRFVVS